MGQMSILKDMKIGSRLYLGFGSILLLLIIMLGLAMYAIRAQMNIIEDILQVEVAKVAQAYESNAGINDAFIAVSALLLSPNVQAKAEKKSELDKSRAAANKALEEMKRLETGDEGKKLLSAYEATLAESGKIYNEIVDLSMSGKTKEWSELYQTKGTEVEERLDVAAMAVVNYEEKLMQESRKEAEESAASSRMMLILLGAVEIILGLLAGFQISRSIIKPINLGVEFASTIADGNLTGKLDIDQKDELGVLARALNRMAGNLGGMFREISGSVQTISAASTELSAISSQMTQSAGQTSAKAGGVAASAEEMSSNMTSVASAMEQTSTNIATVATATEEMTATIGEIAGNSEKARKITSEAVTHAHQITGRVNELGQAARDIGKVTESISAISAQTNLLALNATIEAARAGAAGKGFAVVANEIKELALQTAAATEDIRNRVEGIRNTSGTTVADIEKISAIIKEVNDIVSTIAAAITEQSTVTREIAGNVGQAAQGVREVNENVSQSSAVAQAIAHDISDVNRAAGDISQGSGQVLASAQELSHLAEQLREKVSRFKI
jgi:methyl-accepting chemotaxis protein